MRGNRRRDTGPEKKLRSALFALGLRFRVDQPIKVGEGNRLIRPDIIFPRTKLAVFVDGCFWHRCPAHGTRPSRNSKYWDAKLQSNVDRDRRYDEMLSKANWTVFRVWEHEDMVSVAERVSAFLHEASTD